MQKRITISFDDNFKEVYKKLSEEKNKSKIVCKALEEYYELRNGNPMYEGEPEEIIMTRLEMLLQLTEEVNNEQKKTNKILKSKE